MNQPLHIRISGFHYWAMMVLLILLCIALSACSRTKRLDLCTPTADPNWQWSGPDFASMNTRIEVVNHSDLNAGTLWLHGCVAGEPNCTPDALTVRWDSFTVLWSLDRDVGCNFANVPENQHNDDCERCNYCFWPNNCHADILYEEPPEGSFGPTVVRFEGFIISDSDAPTTVDHLHYASGCPTLPAGASRDQFDPAGKATYRVLAGKFSSDNESCENRKVIAEKKVVVISDLPETTIHPLKLHPEIHPSVVWYKGKMQVDPDWDDSFSSALRVTKIRVQQGTPIRDEVTGRFKLDEVTMKLAHPSRIVLYPGYSDLDSVTDNDTNRCYANASEDGDIDLRSCRRTFGVNCTGPNCSLVANPTYLSSIPGDPITWFIEFNPAEGGIIPWLGANEVLAIEFTIEKV